MKPDLGKPPSTSEITPEALYLRRREFIKNSVLLAATAGGVGLGLLRLLGGGRARPQAPAGPAEGGAVAVEPGNGPGSSAERGERAGSGGLAGSARTAEPGPAAGPAPLVVSGRSPLSTDEPMTPWDAVTTYNNFYEFGTDKADPATYAHTLRARPWTVSIDGEVARPQLLDIDAIVRWFPLEERVYRMRCVEAWSMVIPWLGFPLGELLRRAEPTSRAKYVAFTTLHDPAQMPGQRSRVLDWPYVEGLRMDEAMHPLAILAVGLYGTALPNQNGAPLRLVVPWKYGFKGIKSIVGIRLTESQPPTTWSEAAPREYGFYANVNPEVDHPRWSQASERRIGEFSRRPTLPFNGYAEQVAGLYAGMDLRANF